VIAADRSFKLTTTSPESTSASHACLEAKIRRQSLPSRDVLRRSRAPLSLSGILCVGHNMRSVDAPKTEIVHL
jgi:hypothetical protein